MTTVTLPGADALFQCFCAGWYPDHRRHEDPPELRPDLEEIELPPGTHVSALQFLDPEGRKQTADIIQKIGRAGEADWISTLGVTPPVDEKWLTAFEKAWPADRVLDAVRSSDPSSLDNPWLVLVCETGALVGSMLRQRRPALQWLYDAPYWDSSLFDLNTLVRVPVFHWAARRFSADGCDHPLIDKIEATMEFIQETEQKA